jgi:hypothetical protein
LRDELEEETKNLMGDQWRVLRRVISIQSCTSFMVESKGIHGGVRGGRKEKRKAFTVWEGDLGEMREEREDGGVKGGFHLL